MNKIKLLLPGVFCVLLIFSCTQEEFVKTNNLEEEIELRNNCGAQIFGSESPCENHTITYCIKSATTPNSILWSGHPDINGSTSGCVSLSMSAGNYTLSAAVDINGCHDVLTHEVKVCGQVFTHPNPPLEFTQICYQSGQPVCYDFGNTDECMTAIEAWSNSPNLLIDIVGTEICLTPLIPNPHNVSIAVRALGPCGNGDVEFWYITMNDPNRCAGVDGPPENEPPVFDPPDMSCDESDPFPCPPPYICVFGQCL